MQWPKLKSRSFDNMSRSPLYNYFNSKRQILHTAECWCEQMHVSVMLLSMCSSVSPVWVFGSAQLSERQLVSWALLLSTFVLSLRQSTVEGSLNTQINTYFYQLTHTHSKPHSCAVLQKQQRLHEGTVIDINSHSCYAVQT